MEDQRSLTVLECFILLVNLVVFQCDVVVNSERSNGEVVKNINGRTSRQVDISMVNQSASEASKFKNYERSEGITIMRLTV